MRNFFGALWFLVIACPLHAQTHYKLVNRNSPEFERCTAKHQEDTLWGFRECNEREIELQDVKLSQTYQKRLVRLPTGSKANLQNSQRIWLAQRAPTCKVEAAQKASQQEHQKGRNSDGDLDKLLTFGEVRDVRNEQKLSISSSPTDVIYSSCMIDQTIRRIIWLERYR